MQKNIFVIKIRDAEATTGEDDATDKVTRDSVLSLSLIRLFE
jgi:hypothetical protein